MKLFDLTEGLDIVASVVSSSGSGLVIMGILLSCTNNFRRDTDNSSKRDICGC